MAAEGHSSIDALSQFKLVPVFGHLGESLHFSNANVMMLVASVLTLLRCGRHEPARHDPGPAAIRRRNGL